MKILLASLGTRGDMEPFLAVANLLKTAGHETICLFPEQFRELAEGDGHQFETLGPEFMELLESPIGRIAMGGSGTTWQKIRSYAKLAHLFAPLRKQLTQRQFECLQRVQPDRLVFHAKIISGFVWGKENPGRATLLSPVPYILHPTEELSHIAFNKDWGPWWNRASYKLANLGLIYSIKYDAKHVADYKKLSTRWIKSALKLQPTIYSVSPSLFNRPGYWPDHVQVLGFQERNQRSAWTPEPALQEFLERHKKILFVTFGSMVNPDAEGKTKQILATLEELRIPAILNTAGGGLVIPENYNREAFLFVRTIPYDWILPKVYAVVHHGGSGTTHQGLRHGCATLIIPHIIDQFMWNRVVERLGAGPRGPGITKLNKSRLSPLLKSLWTDPTYKTKAEALASKMATEDHSQEIVARILKPETSP
ncbi:sterol 3beta-glucosyltransferase [Robiginitalea myxolifaciens]|uniref:Sterol 3beta-glucosyltransferase n=1 Tax=Robiginitalea myxolifaciens TaxID=400055 RepID=A0A1I6G0Z4_9FLAO|nr:glycosyltransferase [Robiginitalea myxolifaciens]SFR35727.1 sterol 3beta-glucosyltransferase [Robiginitalea myxolifaciens]